MGPLPTRRLLDATAKLTPADRALLNLWLNRGLDDERLSKLTGMRPEVVVTRRSRLIDRLSEALTLPPDDVQAALAAIAGGLGVPAAGSQAPSTNGHAVLEPATPAGLLFGPAAAARARGRAAGLLLGPGALAAAQAAELQAAGLLLGPGAAWRTAGAAELPEPETPAAELPGPETAPAGVAERPRRRAARIGGAVTVLAAAIIAVIVILASGGAAPHHASARTVSAPAPAAPVPGPTTPGSPPAASPHAPTTPPPGPVAGGFTGLPGGLMHVRGSVQLVGSLKHLRLKLRVRGLPSPHRGHYEVWLFDSILDSTSLGRLGQGTHAVTYALPLHFRRYRWIDISFQPVGYVNHSGESELRATNPAHTTKARLRERSAHRRHQLRRASSGSTAASTSK